MNNGPMLKLMLVGGGVFVALAALGVNITTLLPLVILLGCPLMMFFMMRGMDHGGSHGTDDEVHHGSRRDEER